MEGLRSPSPASGGPVAGPLPRRTTVVVTWSRFVHRTSPVEWPLNRFDALLVAQTYPGRPMTTHHTLELDRPPALDRWVRALEQLVDDYPELSSRVVGSVRARRIVLAPDRSAIRARVIHEHDGSPLALERWLAEPIDPRSELPFRVRVGPAQDAEQAITLSLHHSVADGVGALALFDRLLALAGGGPVRPRRSAPFGGHRDAERPPLRRLWAKLEQLRRPAAQLIDLGDSQASGQHLALRRIDPSIWGSLGRLTRAAGVSRTTALWHAVATVAARQRVDDPGLPLRVLAGVDLRAQLGVCDDALGNWLGTLEHEHPVHDGPESWAQLHAALLDARKPEHAVLTPALLSASVGRLPSPLARAVFRHLDSDAWPSPFSLLLAHIRPREGRCWPLALCPRRLWCASTLPRKPGLGLTFTTVGDRVHVAATCQAGVLRRARTGDRAARRESARASRVAAAQWVAGSHA